MIINIFTGQFGIAFRKWMGFDSVFVCLKCQRQSFMPKINFTELVCHYCGNRGIVKGTIKHKEGCQTLSIAHGQTYKQAKKRLEQMKIGQKNDH